MRIFRACAAMCLLSLAAAAHGEAPGLAVKVVRTSTYATFTRIVLEVESSAPYVLTRSDDNRSLVLAAYNAPLILKAPLPTVRDPVVSRLELREEGGRTSIVIQLEPSAGEAKDFVLRGPDRIVVDIARGKHADAGPPTEQQVVVVLDPGHGGRDTGITTLRGMEKSVALELAQAVRRALQRTPRITALLTRERDSALSLDERAAIANAAGARLFVSIHASSGADTRVFIHDLADDRHIAATQPVFGDFIGFESGRAQQELRWERQQDAHIQDSGRFGRQVARLLSGRADAEPVQAPLALLGPVNAAAVMVEIGSGSDGLQSAEAIARGIERHVSEGK